MSESPILLSDLKSPTQETTQDLGALHRDSFEIDKEVQREENFSFDRKFAVTVCVLWMGNFLCGLDGTVVSTTMSNIASEFGQSDMVPWIATSYLLTSTAFQPLYGKTSDIVGRKPLLLLAQSIFVLGTLLSALAVNVQTLAVARAVAGIGGAGMGALSSIIITDLVPLSKRSVFVGYGTIVGSTSQMLGGPIGGLCIVTIGWRWMFLLQVPFLLFCIFLLASKVDLRVEHIPDGDERFSRENLKRIDFGGIITLNLAVSSIIFLVSQTENTTNLYRVFFSVLLISSSLAFLYIEKYVAVEMIIDPELVRGQIGAFGFTNGVSALGLYMVLFIAPLYLQIVQDVAVTNIGYYTMFFVVSSAIGAVLAGYYIRNHDKSETQTMIAAVNSSYKSFCVQTGGFVGLLLVVAVISPENGSILWRTIFLAGLVVAGLGAGAYNVGIVIFVIGKVGRRGQASANTVVSLIRQLGNVLGVSISLASYTGAVSLGLHEYFRSEGSAYTQSLIKDTSFIRNGLPQTFISDVLLIYKSAILRAFVPPILLIVGGLLVMFLLNNRVKLLV